MATSSRVKIDYEKLVPPPSTAHVIFTHTPKRLIVVGDVHGCLEELQQLLIESNYSKEEGDEVLLVGDLVNKGPFSAETVQYARENMFHCIRGNHDDFALCHALQLVEKSTHPGLQYISKLSQYVFLSFYFHVLNFLMKSVNKLIHNWVSYRDDISWLTDLPYSITIPTWQTVFVHAGIVPTEPLMSQSAGNLVTMRNVVEDAADSSVLLGSSHSNEGAPWISRWTGSLVDAKSILGAEISGEDDNRLHNWHVIFGHDAKRGLQQTPFATGLDTGCSYGTFVIS